MVQITEGRGHHNTVFAIFTTDDRAKYMFTKSMAFEAMQWILRRGYYLWVGEDVAGIRLEKNTHTIITVAKEERFTWGYTEIDCICYAAVLLYIRLKRMGVIA